MDLESFLVLIQIKPQAPRLVMPVGRFLFEVPAFPAIHHPGIQHFDFSYRAEGVMKLTNTFL